MATNFPGSKDDNSTLPNPTSGSYTNSPSHAGLHDNANDAIKAIETKLGTGSSTPGGSGQLFVSNSAGVSAWQTYSVGGDLTGSLPNPALVGTGVTPGNYGSNTQVPVLTIDSKGRVTAASTTPVSSGGGGGGITSPLTTKGDIWVYSTVDTRLPVGTNGQILSADSTQATGLKWIAAPNSAVWGAITGTLSSQTDLQTALNAKASLTGTETLQNKTLDNTDTVTLKANKFTLQDSTDTTKTALFLLNNLGTGSTANLIVPDAQDWIVLRSTTDTLSNKTLNNTNTIVAKSTIFTIQDQNTPTKQAKFDLTGITAANTRTLTVPDASGTLVLTDNSATLSNKTLDAPTTAMSADPTTNLGVATKQYVDNKITKTTDANGWTVYDNRTWKEYRKRVTFTSVSVSTGATSLPISSTSLPVGISTLASVFMNYDVATPSFAGALVVSFEGSSANTSLNFTASSTDATRTYSGFIDLVLVGQ